MKKLSRDKSLQILDRILSNPTEIIRIRQLAKEAGVSAATVSNVVRVMEQKKLVRRNMADLSEPLTRALKFEFNIRRLRPLIKIIRVLMTPIGLGVYGSWSKGTNTSSSDLDLWITVETYPDALLIARLRKKLREKLNTEISLLFLTPQKIKDTKTKNPPLYYSLIHSFFLWGEPVE